MPITNTPQNPHNNTAPVILNQDNYADPIQIAALFAEKAGLPKPVLDTITTHCEDLVKDSWLGFLDMFQMNFAIETDYVNFLETEMPDYIIDDDGAITRTANEFVIDWSAVEGHEVGEDAFFYRPNDVIAVYDNTGKKEMGVIETVDKANNSFIAKSRHGADWSVETTNLTLDVTGGDFDKGSCGPDGLMELRKRKSRTLKLQTIKDAMDEKGGERYAYCDENNDIKWYDENTMFLMKRLNKKIAKTLLLDVESTETSGAYAIGKYGTQGLFDNLEENSLVHTGYITDVAQLEAVTTYWNDELGFREKDFIAHVDNTQYRHFEKIAGQIATQKGVELHVVLNNTDNNYFRFGFNSLTYDGFTIYFSKWDLTTGNSQLGKKRMKDAMPKGIIMPKGLVTTKVNGVEKKVPYIFKVYQNLPRKQGMIRTFMSGGFNGDGDCEYSKITKSTTVGIAVVCPEAIVMIK